MAIRPIFIPKILPNTGVEERLLEFKWHPGMAKTQKQKSISELHCVARKNGIKEILEISTKSENELGVKLSAFNLVITTKKNKKRLTVETAFQGSKVFQKGGPYRDLFGMDSRTAKKDIRLKESGSLTRFEFFGKSFSLEPRTFFYDWLYINALIQNRSLSERIMDFQAFSDIEFNPTKSINCQAHSVALYVSLVKQGIPEETLVSPSGFLDILSSNRNQVSRQIESQDSLL